MTDPQPLVCVSFRHPPEERLFLRLKEILSTFPELFDQLSLALTEAQGKYPYQEAAQILQEVRVLAGTKTDTLFNAIFCGSQVAERYIGLFQTLQRQEDYRPSLFLVKNGAVVGVKDIGISQQAMIELREGLGDAFGRITTAMKGQKKRSNTSTFAIDNVQTISELYSAVDECNGVLQECRDYFEETIKQTSDEDLLESDPPSEEEIRVMWEKWEAFQQITASLTARWKPIIDSIKRPPAQGGPASSTAAASSQSPQTNNPPSQSSPKSTSKLRAFWQKLFRRPTKTKSRHTSDNSEGPRRPTTSDAPSAEPSPEISSRRRAFWRPTCLSTTAFH